MNIVLGIAALIMVGLLFYSCYETSGRNDITASEIHMSCNIQGIMMAIFFLAAAICFK